jgi:calcium-dependent protein kinase
MAEKQKGFNKEEFVGKMAGKLEDKYEIIKEIGSGGFSRCLLVKNKNTGLQFACKELPKKNLSDYEGLMREVNLMIQLDHPNIIKLYEVYENEKNIYLIMELCTGGELFDRITLNTENGIQFTEKQAASLFKQMMSAINYCHKNGIVHRDLKPENLLYLNEDENSPIKVIDFGMSKRFDSKSLMSEKVGTAYYISPEILQGKYDEKCDIWSAGVILYIIICGYPCFNGEDDDEIFAAILKGDIAFPSPEWDDVSDDVKILIKKMLSSPDKRLTAEQVLKETWVKDNAPNAGKALLPLKIDPFKNYSNSNKLRKAVLTYIASRLSEEEIQKIKAIFESIDIDNDGKLSLEEMKKAVSLSDGMKPEYIEQIFKSIDTDNSGNIEYTEFISASIEKSIYLNKEKLKDAFKLFDIDNSGKISRAEIERVLHVDKNSKEIDAIMDKHDKNKDGEIDFQEFIEMMKEFA